MNKKIKSKEIQDRINSLDLDFKLIEYNGSKNPSIFLHNKCCTDFKMRISHLLERKKCPKCDGRKLDFDDFQIKSNKVHNNEYEIIEFKGTNFYVKLKHLVCGTTYNQRGSNHLRGDSCSYCFGNKKHNKEDLIKMSYDKWGNEFTILSDEINYNKKSLIRHNKCDNNFEQVISHHITKGGCKFCAGNNKHTIESVQEKSNKIHNNEYIILSEPNGSLSKIKILHKVCNKEYSQVLSTHLDGCGCNCNNVSKGEKYIESILIEMNLNFEKQKTFKDCKYKNKLRFDFYLPDFNTCIEFDGQQHFRPIKWFGGKPQYELQIIKDDIKNEYCKINNIELIRFRYDDNFDKISNILKNIMYICKN